MAKKYRIVVLGLSITSSWGNGHATTYRGLLRELCRRGHEVTFLERDTPWYAAHRDLPCPPYGSTFLYADLAQLHRRFAGTVAEADLVILGSYVPEGTAVADWLLSVAEGVTAFYDIDTPVTLAKLRRGEEGYLALRQVPQFDLYLSFSGGPVLEAIEREFGARKARPLYCSVDPDLHYPEAIELQWDLGYLGTYSDDRQPKLEQLLLEPARRMEEAFFTVAGPQYPGDVRWPANLVHFDHLPPEEHRSFYNAQRFTLNITRADMVRSGWSPSVRLFEAAACGVPIISDAWEGIESFFVPGKEILIARSGPEVVSYLRDFPEPERLRLAKAARAVVLAQHSSACRARELEGYLEEEISHSGREEAAATLRAAPSQVLNQAASGRPLRRRISA